MSEEPIPTRTASQMFGPTMAEQMLAMLERLEFCGYLEGVDRLCPMCGHYTDPKQHAPDCELSALLRRARGES
jgi:hypothetical protein